MAKNGDGEFAFSPLPPPPPPNSSASRSRGSGVTWKRKKPRKILLPHHIAANRKPQLVTYLQSLQPVTTKKDNIVSNRRDACLLAQLRSGHCKQLAHYANRIDEKTSPTCRRCNEEPETVEHWLKCPATVMKRQQHFGRDNVDLGILSRAPERSLAFAKTTLL